MINKIKQMFNKVNGDIVAGNKIQNFSINKSKKFYKEIFDILNQNLTKRAELHHEVRKSILIVNFSEPIWWADQVVEEIFPKMKEIGMSYDEEIHDYLNEIKALSPKLFKLYTDAFGFESQTRGNIGQLLLIPEEQLQNEFGRNFIEMYEDIIKRMEDMNIQIINEVTTLLSDF